MYAKHFTQSLYFALNPNMFPSENVNEQTKIWKGLINVKEYTCIKSTLLLPNREREREIIRMNQYLESVQLL